MSITVLRYQRYVLDFTILLAIQLNTAICESIFVLYEQCQHFYGIT